ncbi:DUF1844 domain-containing protein [Poriferisphaera sp. WC338]|uniref:DUF1844 domain-containing protein n=1 Tax=Poriferisphaera sp. WC338 TaxID=3425129 RepID=UPI003D81AAE6
MSETPAPGSPDNETPKIQIDSDWKAQAQAEKEKLAESAKGDDTASSAGPGQLPPANFETLVGTFVTQALLYLGAIPDPSTGKGVVHLDMARFNIDMLSVLEEKTKGNITKEEEETIATTLYELRNRYMQLSQSPPPTQP